MLLPLPQTRCSDHGIIAFLWFSIGGGSFLHDIVNLTEEPEKSDVKVGCRNAAALVCRPQMERERTILGLDYELRGKFDYGHSLSCQYPQQVESTCHLSY